MELTTTVEDVIHVGEKQFTGLMIQLIRDYKFTHRNQMPREIVFPAVDVVEGVTITREVKPVVDEVAHLEPEEPEEPDEGEEEEYYAVTSGEVVQE